MGSGSNKLEITEWIVFGGTLCIALGIGIYHSLGGGRQKTTSEYLLGNRQMHLIPVTLSMTVSFISTLTLLGYPAEIYSFGSQYWMGIWGGVLAAILASVIYVPLFYPLKLVSVNEYLEMRFKSKVVKSIGSACTVLSMIVYTGTVFYGPCTAIEAVSGLPVVYCIIIGGLVCLTYTTLGGFKAVIWTDVFQSVIMVFGAVAVLIRGIVLMGSYEKVWNINGQWDRLQFFDFDPDPGKRMNFYGVIVGNGLTWLGILGYYQTAVQRFSSLPNIKLAKLSVLLAMPGMCVLVTLSCLIGQVVFAYYADIGCDPMKEGEISSANQILPYFVATQGGFPMLAGIFIAALSASSLSSASSALSAAAANIWADLVHPAFPNLNVAKAAFVTRFSVLICGCLGMVVAFLMVELGGTMLQVSSTFLSATAGPAHGLYLIGAFVPWVNWKGASCGAVLGMCYGTWISIGSYSMDKQWTTLPTPAENCSLISDAYFNVTDISNIPYALENSTISSNMDSHELSFVQRLYSVSFLWMREVNTAVTIISAILISFLTGYTKPSEIEKEYMHPIVSKFFTLKTKSEESSGIPCRNDASDTLL